ncbi:MAG: hypothetical protein H3C62_02340 [Gemmatimonadaceae bacterium]|nr:hypothetical protein [Gemmatimonadaceae bacterium]
MLTGQIDVRCTPAAFATMLHALGAFWTGRSAPTVVSPRTGALVEPLEVASARQLLPFAVDGAAGGTRVAYVRAR